MRPERTAKVFVQVPNNQRPYLLAIHTASYCERRDRSISVEMNALSNLLSLPLLHDQSAIMNNTIEAPWSLLDGSSRHLQPLGHSR